MSLSKGSYEFLREQNKVRKLVTSPSGKQIPHSSPSEDKNYLLTRQTLTVLLREQSRPRNEGGGQTSSLGEVKHNRAHLTHPPSVRSGEPAPSDSHPSPH